MNPLDLFMKGFPREKSEKQEKKDKKLKEVDQKAAEGSKALKKSNKSESQKLEKNVRPLPPKTPPAVPFLTTKLTRQTYEESLESLSHSYQELLDLTIFPAKKQKTFEELLLNNPNLLPKFRDYKRIYNTLESLLQEAGGKKWANDPGIHEKLESLEGPALAFDRVGSQIEIQRFVNKENEEISKRKEKDSQRTNAALTSGEMKTAGPPIQAPYKQPESRKPVRAESRDSLSIHVLPMEDDFDDMQNPLTYTDFPEKIATKTARLSEAEAKQRFESKLDECTDLFNPAYIRLFKEYERTENDIAIVKENAPKILKLIKELRDLAGQFKVSSLKQVQRDQLDRYVRSEVKFRQFLSNP